MSTPAVIVLDFETTGHSPNRGDRPIEVGAVRIEHDRIVDRFQALMNPGFTISWFIERLTGISNDLIAHAPPCEEVMNRFADWMGDLPLVAHNAGFDRAFLDAELALIGRHQSNPMACTVLASRRLFPESPNHKLATLVNHLGIFTDGTFHRALADAEMTGHVWIAMTDVLCDRYGLDEIPFTLMQELGRIGRAKVDRYLRNLADRQKTCLGDSGIHSR
ncbi:DNA polymerase III, epsilon subunit [Desulfobulbus propionicus DSM 2032]|jgi:DNA polymerase-3 subunit epsilon|uniref:DNA polymerase III, epsilon subunit n=1 Tax=Desulfobulbus propionicus (strain ATCC 33891 / DSM 2032 / VKM B-1956 / 1pr3) TaxID=577650 RepID=A0A7U3YLV1_DESPD|nr:3'-5' exonuclease [Desulfobulbus propionicus]ADW17778.1 DNA polymerase III, epsilon subunit [Desulfobulbus propionicus DSM 2032]